MSILPQVQHMPWMHLNSTAHGHHLHVPGQGTSDVERLQGQPEWPVADRRTTGQAVAEAGEGTQTRLLELLVGQPEA